MKPINYIVILFIALFLSYTIVDSSDRWQKSNTYIGSDVICYNSYLVATFIKHDINDLPWGIELGNNKKVAKVTMGMSFLYAPFFIAADIFANPTATGASEGYSAPYQLSLFISSMFYLIVGLFFLNKFLLNFFTNKIVALTTFLLFFGTNLYAYTTIHPLMPHAYSFSLISIFLYLSHKWHKETNYKNSILLGLIIGLLILARPANTFVLVFFILWNVYNLRTLKLKLIFYNENYLKLLIVIVSFFLVWIPQMIYWKYTTGQYFVNGYNFSNERAYFNNPQIILGLFSYRNGWLLYTPLMSFALVGIIIMYKKMKHFFLGSLIYISLTTFIVLSWWCWWYSGFGNRAFIDSYSLLSIPLACTLTYLFQKGIALKIITSIILAFFVYLNIFQTAQYNNGAINYTAMTKKAYWANFGKIHPIPNLYLYFDYPDCDKAVKGIID